MPLSLRILTVRKGIGVNFFNGDLALHAATLYHEVKPSQAVFVLSRLLERFSKLKNCLSRERCGLDVILCVEDGFDSWTPGVDGSNSQVEFRVERMQQAPSLQYLCQRTAFYPHSRPVLLGQCRVVFRLST